MTTLDGEIGQFRNEVNFDRMLEGADGRPGAVPGKLDMTSPEMTGAVKANAAMRLGVGSLGADPIAGFRARSKPFRDVLVALMKSLQGGSQRDAGDRLRRGRTAALRPRAAQGARRGVRRGRAGGDGQEHVQEHGRADRRRRRRGAGPWVVIERDLGSPTWAAEQDRVAAVLAGDAAREAEANRAVRQARDARQAAQEDVATQEIDLALALAGLTESSDDDIVALTRMRDLRQRQFDEALQAGDPAAIIAAADALQSAREGLASARQQATAATE